MNHRPRHAHLRSAAALATTAAMGVLLVSCGSNDTGDEIADPDQEQKQEDNAAPDTPDTEFEADDEAPAPTEDDIERPDIQVADYLTLEFEKPEHAEPVESAVLHDNEQQLTAVFGLLSTHDTEKSALTFYTTGEALENDAAVLDQIIADGDTSGGTMRFTDRKILNITDGIAEMQYCRDYSQVYDMDFASGEITGEADETAVPTLYEIRLQLSDDGIWQTTHTRAEGKSETCT